MKRTSLSIVVAVLLLVGTRGAARATPCQDSSQDLVRAAGLLDDQASKAKLWNWTWGSIFGVGVIGQLALAERVEDPAVRLNLRVGAFKSFLGMGNQILFPLRIPRASSDCEKNRSLLELAYERERRKRWGWFTHTSAIALNVAGTLYVGFETDNWRVATIGSATGLAIGYLSVFTAPSGLLSEESFVQGLSLSPSLSMETGVPQGLALSGRF